MSVLVLLLMLILVLIICTRFAMAGGLGIQMMHTTEVTPGLPPPPADEAIPSEVKA